MQIHLRAIWLAVTLLLLPRAAPAQDVEETPEAPAATQPVVERTIGAPLDADARRIVEASNRFSLDLLRAVAPSDQNLIVSPASVSAAVGFAYRGAAGETAAQLQKVMHYPFDPVRNLVASSGVLKSMSFSATGRDLRTANSIWLQEGMPFAPAFERDLQQFAQSGLERADFKSDPEAARLRINRWVSDATNANIPELLQKGIITTNTRATLVNAIWFKAEWLSPFGKGQTKIEPFTQLEGKAVPQYLMNQAGHFQVLKLAGIRAVQMPYRGGEVALVAFLPDKPGGLPEFEKQLTSNRLSKWLADLDAVDPRQTILTFPKMTMRWNADLAPTLAGMGAPLPFSSEPKPPLAADFSAMAKLPYPGGNPDEVGLRISHVIHEATVEIDEVGSEASAATAVVMDIVVSGARRGPPPPPPFVFRADKPFLFALRDLRTGLILFMGRYVGPEPAVEAPAP